MEKHFVKWQTVRMKNRTGQFYQSEVPEGIDRRYRGKLLSSILDMPRKKPISFADAVRKAFKKSFALTWLGKPKEATWLLDNFVQYISDLGYHIELNGDEFEHSVTVDKAA
jgi:hypothetical protein